MARPSSLSKYAAVVFLAAALILSSSSCSILRKRLPSDPPSPKERTTRRDVKKTKGEILADSIVDYAKKSLGAKYKTAGATPAGFDCSGLVVYVFSNFGISVPRTSAAQYSASKRISDEDLRPGDLVFFNGSRIGGGVGHVAIITEVLGKGKFRMIHSTTRRGVCIDTFPEGPYYPPRLIGYGRVLPE